MTAENTTHEMTGAFADALKQELLANAKMAKKRFDDAQAKFIADVQVNPISAIGWKSDDMVKLQTRHEVWLRIECELAEHDGREVLAANRDEVNYRVRAFFGSNSTSLFSNAVERARAEAYVQLAEDIERLCKHHGIE
jgi:hypothetical protein